MRCLGQEWPFVRSAQITSCTEVQQEFDESGRLGADGNRGSSRASNALYSGTRRQHNVSIDEGSKKIEAKNEVKEK